MLKSILLVAAIALTASSVQADPHNKQSGRGVAGWGHSKIPPGHLPPPGMCRVWYFDLPPGHQPPPMDCREAQEFAYWNGGTIVWGR